MQVQHSYNSSTNWLIFTYSRSHAFRYRIQIQILVFTKIELTTSALVGVLGYLTIIDHSGGTRNIQTLLSKATLDPSITNENHNILPPLKLSTISFKSLRNILLLKTSYPDDHIQVVFTTRVYCNPRHHHTYAKFHIEMSIKSVNQISALFEHLKIFA